MLKYLLPLALGFVSVILYEFVFERMRMKKKKKASEAKPDIEAVTPDSTETPNPKF